METIFFIDTEVGNEYEKCEVPKYMEVMWRYEIRTKLLCDILNSTGNKRLNATFRYTEIISGFDAIAFLIYLLNKVELDKFTRIVLTEDLRENYRMFKSKYSLNEQLINNEIDKSKEKLLNDKSQIDECFVNSPHMRYYDFSDEAITERIKKI